ncbi:hypothetical protein QMZ92_10185 [Streptomyces sp. HNM0645]|uniref:hypothetical protein n=1 Tax=Streptomyces sp. HNM0645 TaxID=2782343 RepID=UPI0024B678BA|nr:hypothetical protein [Streptomyces sp. HNM0645]MDI9884752.1 hypothetical protein [Streptomyces sp. HNM0645]
MANTIRRVLATAVSTPELEQIKGVWNMGVFGLGQWRRMDFTPLHQEWMRRACKTWVLDEIPRRYGKNIPNSLSEMILCLRFLWQSLVRSREDRGENMAALGRSDIEAFTQYVAHLEHAGEISSFRRTTVSRFTGRFLREIRDMGLPRPGEILADLPDDFALRRHDMPPVITEEGPGRALPREILSQLCERLPTLDQIRDGSDDMRNAIEILVDTGRRPDEIGCLPWDCLETDEHSKSVLICTDFKNNRTGCRLPIPDSTAEIIVRQKKSVRARFPDTDLSKLVLFPRPAGLRGHQAVPHAAHRQRPPPLGQRHATPAPHRRHRVPRAGSRSLLLPALLRATTRGRRNPARRAPRAHGAQIIANCTNLLSGDREADPVRSRQARLAPIRPARQPDLDPGPPAPGARTRPPAHRPGLRPLRHLRRADQRQGQRPWLPVPVPLRRLRSLPHRPVILARAAGLPRHPPARPRTPRRRNRTRRLGPHRIDPV